jgi:hypothetical protein
MRSKADNTQSALGDVFRGQCHYNKRRYPESRDKTPQADAYFGSAEAIIKQDERIKCLTIQHRRLQNRKITASLNSQEKTGTPLIHHPF